MIPTDKDGNIEILTREEAARRDQLARGLGGAVVIAGMDYGAADAEVVHLLEREGVTVLTTPPCVGAAQLNDPPRRGTVQLVGRQSHRRIGIASMQSLAIGAALAAAAAGEGQIYNPNTGRAISRRNSQRLDEERLRRRAIIDEGRRAGMHPALVAPYSKARKQTPEDLARIAAAEAKRARKAQKRSK